MPGSALFFLTYEHVKRMNYGGGAKQHMLASSLGEIMACLVRVPTEVCSNFLFFTDYDFSNSNYDFNNSIYDFSNVVS